MNYVVFSLILLLTSCAGLEHRRSVEIDYSPAPSVSASEALQIAESYRVHQWTPTRSNVFHGLDPDKVAVNTPDVSLKEDLSARPGWWKVNQTNYGIPYQWGGFDTPDSFDQKIKSGYYAGDVYTKAKRSQLYSAVSSYACGVDCSGFVSRCWRLPRAYSTRELPSISEPLSSFQELEAGDIVNKRNVHVLLFEAFLDKEKKHFMAYETGAPPSWRVLRHVISVEHVKSQGYTPYRYHHMEKSE